MKKKGLTILFIVILVLAAFNFNAGLGLLLVIAGLIYVVYRSLPTIFMFIGNQKYVSANIQQAMPWYERSYKLKHAKPMVVINYAYVLLKQGQIDKAEPILRDMLKKNLDERDRANAIINLSLVLWKNGNLQEAVSLLEELYNDGYKNTLVYQNLGFYYILQGDLSKALEFNQEAYNYNSADASILDNLAMNYYFLKDYDKAVETYEKLMPMKPSFVTTYYYYGLTLEKKGQLEEALDIMERALNYRFSYLSAVTREEVEKEINRLKNDENKEQ